MSDLSRDEFYHALEALTERMTDGFGQINTRLDRINGSVGRHETEIAVWKNQCATCQTEMNKDKTARASGIVGSLLAGAALVWQYFKP